MNLAEQLKEAQGKVTAFDQQVQGLTAERDQLAGQVEALTAERDQAAGQVGTITAERDQLTEKITSLTAERDQASAQLAAVAKERDTAKAQLALSPGHQDLSTGTDAGSAGTSAGGAEGQSDEAWMKAYNAAKPAEKRKMWLQRRKEGFSRLGLTVAVAAVTVVTLLSGVLVSHASGKAYDQVILEATNVSTGTVATTVSDKLVGAIESITVIVPSGVTCDVAVATSTMTLLTKADATGTETYMPRYTIHDSTGAVNTNTTDAVDKVVVVDTVTASYDECSTTNQTIKTLINYAK